MTKIVLFVFVLFVFGSCIVVPPIPSTKYGANQEMWDDFLLFIVRFKKDYSSLEEDELMERFDAFEENMKKITDLKEQFPDSTFEITKFFDISDEEYRETFLRKIDVTKELKSQDPSDDDKSDSKTPSDESTSTQLPLPESFDWRDHGVMTKVKDQGSCGSCWIFATLAVIEAKWAIVTGELNRDFSEQQIMDCETLFDPSQGDPCDGGWPARVYDFFKDGGMMYETDYEYEEEKQDECKADTRKFRARISGYDSNDAYAGPKINSPLDEDVIKKAIIIHGPVTTRLDWQNGAIMGFDVENENSQTDMLLKMIYGCSHFYEDSTHAVVFVGWTKNYWIVRNSHGEDWGSDGGYFLYPKGVNKCGIENIITWPTIDSGYKNGEVCVVDGECFSGSCLEGKCVQCRLNDQCEAYEYCDIGFDYVCKPKKEQYQSCLTDVQCKSNECNRGPLFGILEGCAGCKDHSYCPNDHYCFPEDKVQTAQDWANIESCLPLKSTGEVCRWDFVCRSKKCRKGKCKECEVDVNCASDYFCPDEDDYWSENELYMCTRKRDTREVCYEGNHCFTGVCKNQKCVCETDEQCGDGKSCNVVGECTADLGGWFPVGKLSELESKFNEYSPLEYVYGIVYNSIYPIEIIPSTGYSKSGLRVVFKQNYPQGDSKDMVIGNCVFTRQTNDYDNTNYPAFKHSYGQLTGDGTYTHWHMNYGYNSDPNIYVIKINPWVKVPFLHYVNYDPIEYEYAMDWGLSIPLEVDYTVYTKDFPSESGEVDYEYVNGQYVKNHETFSYKYNFAIGDQYPYNVGNVLFKKFNDVWSATELKMNGNGYLTALQTYNNFLSLGEVSFYVRKRTDNWIKVGMIKEMDHIVNTYPVTDFVMGINPSKAAETPREITESSYTYGWRILLKNDYPCSFDNTYCNLLLKQGTLDYDNGQSPNWKKSEVIVNTEIGSYYEKEINVYENKYVYVKLRDSPFVKIGDMSDFSTLIHSYPLYEYEWGVQYLSNSIWPVMILNFNLGYRMIFKNNVPLYDAVQGVGNVMFKFQTADYAGSDGAWLHYYVILTGGVYHEIGSNGYLDLPIYARKLVN